MTRAAVKFAKECYVQVDAEPVEWIMDFAEIPRIGERVEVRENSDTDRTIARGRVSDVRHATWTYKGQMSGAHQIEIVVLP